jgi:hypothetical protein
MADTVGYFGCGRADNYTTFRIFCTFQHFARCRASKAMEYVLVQSRECGDFNTIGPPCFSMTTEPWLAFGSYWSGIKLVQLDPRTGKRLLPDAAFSLLASAEACAVH